MLDPLLISAIACIGAGMVLSYLLGRWHGMSIAYDDLRAAMRADELAGDGPASGDPRPFKFLNHLHESGVSDAGA